MDQRQVEEGEHRPGGRNREQGLGQAGNHTGYGHMAPQRSRREAGRSFGVRTWRALNTRPGNRETRNKF